MAPVLNYECETRELRELSARLGHDPLLVQASTGNTSIKIGRLLWIKASGRWFFQSDAEDFLVAVDLMAAREALREGIDTPTGSVARGEGSPSIETAMHAALPQNVVLHVHSVNAIAWAVREDGPEQLRARLRGLRWQWIPYRPSGIPLAREIQSAISSRPAPEVFVLANHGLVICEDTCGGAERLLREVESRIATAPRSAPGPDASRLGEEIRGSDWHVPDCEEIHTLATDATSRRISSQGVLYPCQAIFLPDTVLAHGELAYRRAGAEAIRVIDGRGVLLNRGVTLAQRELLRGLAEVVRRVDPGAPVRYLTPSETLGVLRGPAYRESPLVRAIPGRALSASQVQ
jgi:rhamnose utilization protein RhaD (predicted bifunctional aldolase and dehydrogenase)